MSADDATGLSAQMYMASMAATVTRFLTGAPLGEGDWYFEVDWGSIPLNAVRGLFVYVVAHGDALSHEVGYHDGGGLGNYDYYPAALYQVVSFGRTRDGSTLPSSIQEGHYLTQLVPLVFSDMYAIGLHVAPTVQIQVVALGIPPV